MCQSPSQIHYLPAGRSKSRTTDQAQWKPLPVEPPQGVGRIPLSTQRPVISLEIQIYLFNQNVKTSVDKDKRAFMFEYKYKFLETY